MLKKLVIPVFALTLSSFYGCSSDSKTDAGSGGGSAGSGGSAGTSGSAGSDGAASDSAASDGSAASDSAAGSDGSGSGGSAGGGGAAGSGGSPTDGGTGGSEGGAETSPETVADRPFDTAGDGAAGICASYVPGRDSLPGISPDSFCLEYADTCGFTNEHYGDMDGCRKAYGDSADTPKACRAGHLCNAKVGNPEMQCEHAAGLSVCD